MACSAMRRRLRTRLKLPEAAAVAAVLEESRRIVVQPVAVERMRNIAERSQSPYQRRVVESARGENGHVLQLDSLAPQQQQVEVMVKMVVSLSVS